MSQTTLPTPFSAQPAAPDERGQFWLDLHGAAVRMYVCNASHGRPAAGLVREVTRIEAALERHYPDLWAAHRAGLLAAESALWHSPDLPISGCAICRHGPRLQNALDVPAPPRR
jgi:hypothetical protein